MSKQAFPFALSDADQILLTQLVAKGKESARKLNRARAWQFSHQGQRPQQVSKLSGLSVPTVYNIRKPYREAGLEQALAEKNDLVNPER